MKRRNYSAWELIQIIKELSRAPNCWCKWPPILGSHEDRCTRIRKIVAEEVKKCHR